MIVKKHRLVQTVDGFWQTTLASEDKPDAVFMDSPVGAPFAVGMKAEESENIFGFEGKKHRINQSISGEWQFTLTSLDIPDWLIHTPPGVEVDVRAGSREALAPLPGVHDVPLSARLMDTAANRDARARTRKVCTARGVLAKKAAFRALRTSGAADRRGAYAGLKTASAAPAAASVS